MYTSIKSILFTSMCFAFLSCQKEISEKTGLIPDINSDRGSSSGTSRFTLAGSPGNCIDQQVSGSYSIGTSLTAANTVDINVSISSPGTYTISTATINGISFSATGTFTSIGTQRITLTGSGTPITPGTFNYKPGTVWCSFPITVATVAPNPEATGTLDCSQAWSDGSFVHGIAMNTSNRINVPITVTTAGTYSIQCPAINGTIFSGSGTLQTGEQIVVLTGSGMPASQGTFPLEVRFGESACSLTVTFQ
ncbi:MAG: hypothetical protein ABIO04_08615 [Ferruginibacter sp.]